MSGTIEQVSMTNGKAAQQQEVNETGGQFMYPSMLIAAGTDKIILP